MRSTSHPLPPVGPAWFPMAMGAGILATLLQLATPRIPIAHSAAVVMLILAWAVLAALVVGFGRRIARDVTAFTSSVRNPRQVPLWGAVSMGILSVGAATTTVVPATWPDFTTAAWRVDAALWTLGTAIGLVTAFGFTVRLIREDCGAPSTTRGLAVVGPMVSATTGAALVPHTDPTVGAWLLAATVGCFLVSLVLGGGVFTVAYLHHWRTAPVPLAASCSAWIPLGMVGQSTAAAQTIADAATPAVAPTIHTIANVYGICMLLLGLPLVAWAIAVTARGFRGRMPFSPGWWALTFPIGTLALGSSLLGRGLGEPVLAMVGLGLTAVLCGTVTLCALATAAALQHSRVGRSAVPAATMAA